MPAGTRGCQTRARVEVAYGTQAIAPSSRVRCPRRESVERAICASRAVSTTVAPASTASTARRWCRKRSRWVSGRVEARTGRNDTHALVWLWLCLKRLRCSDRSVARQLRGERVWENGRGIRGNTNQRSQPGERDRREINEQMASGRTLCTPLLDSDFPCCLWPAFSET